MHMRMRQLYLHNDYVGARRGLAISHIRKAS